MSPGSMPRRSAIGAQRPLSVPPLAAGTQAGERVATDELLTLVYDDLRRLAERCLARESGPNTLQATALVHEAYVRLAGSGQGWESRAHFFGAASRAIRRILLDRARTRRSERRGGAWARLPLDVAGETAVGAPDLDWLALDEVLERLADLDATKARVVELRFFGGLGVDETAAVMGTSASTVEREWRFARAWLHRELESPEGGP